MNNRQEKAKELASDLLSFLGDFVRDDGEFDADYLKDMVDNDSLDIEDLCYRTMRLCLTICPDEDDSWESELAELLPQDGIPVDISDMEEAPSWTFFDGDNNGYTDCAVAVRLKDGKVQVRWEGERNNPKGWEPLEWISDEDGFEDFVDALTECLKEKLEN